MTSVCSLDKSTKYNCGLIEDFVVSQMAFSLVLNSGWLTKTHLIMNAYKISWYSPAGRQGLIKHYSLWITVIIWLQFCTIYQYHPSICIWFILRSFKNTFGIKMSASLPCPRALGAFYARWCRYLVQSPSDVCVKLITRSYLYCLIFYISRHGITSAFFFTLINY